MILLIEIQDGPASEATQAVRHTTEYTDTRDVAMQNFVKNNAALCVIQQTRRARNVVKDAM
eukprot:1357222-Amphidinium_carterae.1